MARLLIEAHLLCAHWHSSCLPPPLSVCLSLFVSLHLSPRCHTQIALLILCSSLNATFTLPTPLPLSLSLLLSYSYNLSCARSLPPFPSSSPSLASLCVSFYALFRLPVCLPRFPFCFLRALFRTRSPKMAHFSDVPLQRSTTCHIVSCQFCRPFRPAGQFWLHFTPHSTRASRQLATAATRCSRTQKTITKTTSRITTRRRTTTRTIT